MANPAAATKLTADYAKYPIFRAAHSIFRAHTISKDILYGLGGYLLALGATGFFYIFHLPNVSP